MHQVYSTFFLWSTMLRTRWAATALLVFTFLLPLSNRISEASTDPAMVCDDAARHVARQSEVPLDVLRAITRAETGRGKSGGMKPWPWTVNMEGEGIWFDTEDQARAYVFRHFKNGARSFDIGCFQINYRWHHQAFNSIEEMFDPIVNAQYAARFLMSLYAELGSWDSAVGAYHSRTQKYASRYLNKYTEIRRDLPDSNVSEQGSGMALLRPTKPTYALGSLVSLGSSPARSILVKQGN